MSEISFLSAHVFNIGTIFTMIIVNSIRPGGCVNRIVTKTVHKTVPGVGGGPGY